MAACLFYYSHSEASILFVPDNYTSINSALQASQFGDTVLARRGVYHETVVAPNWDITIAGEFLLTRDSLDIDSCIIRPTADTLGRRCIFASSDLLTHRLSLQGLTLRHGGTNAVNGGAIYCENRNLEMISCKIDSCNASFGGAMFLHSCQVILDNCRIYRNRAELGNVLYLYNGKAFFTNCEIAYSLPNVYDYEISGDSASVFLNHCHIHNLGFNGWGTSLFRLHYFGLMDTLQTKNCLIENSRFNTLISANTSAGVYHFFFDSNFVAQNQVTGWLYGAVEIDSCVNSSFINNTFIDNTQTPGALGHGLLILGDATERTIMTDNIFENNFSGELSCVSVGSAGNTGSIFTRNVFVRNSNSALLNPPGGAVTLLGTSDGSFYYNIFIDNLGYAAWHGNFNPQGAHAEYNYWGAASGPYDSISNPTGEGDTVDFRITYSPWELDTIFENTVDEPFILYPSSFSLSTYPNPFNSSVRLVIAGFTGREFRLTLHNLLAQEIAEIAKGPITGGQIVYNAPASLASGVYIVRASDQQFIQTKKIVFLK